MKNLYGLYYDDVGSANFKGIMRKEPATEVLLSNIPKNMTPLTQLYFNQDGYIKYCKDYKEYWSWVNFRNESRYENTIKHGKNYDTKNMMHTFRLLDMAEEILVKEKINVHRKNREELLSIRRGEHEYDELIKKADFKIKTIEQAYLTSTLPEFPNLKIIEKMLFDIRSSWYQNDF